MCIGLQLLRTGKNAFAKKTVWLVPSKITEQSDVRVSKMRSWWLPRWKQTPLEFLHYGAALPSLSSVQDFCPLRMAARDLPQSLTLVPKSLFLEQRFSNKTWKQCWKMFLLNVGSEHDILSPPFFCNECCPVLCIADCRSMRGVTDIFSDACSVESWARATATKNMRSRWMWGLE